MRWLVTIGVTLPFLGLLWLLLGPWRPFAEAHFWLAILLLPLWGLVCIGLWRFLRRRARHRDRQG